MIFTRSRVFYTRPRFDGPHSSVVVGLPQQRMICRTYLSESYLDLDILNRLKSERTQRLTQSDDYRDPSPRDLQKDSQTLAKYIFPRSYGLSNVFVISKGSAGTAKPTSYFDRDPELKQKKSWRTPRRIKGRLPLLEKMVHMHCKCAYKPLLNLSSPSKVFSNSFVAILWLINASYVGPKIITKI